MKQDPSYLPNLRSPIIPNPRSTLTSSHNCDSSTLTSKITIGKPPPMTDFSKLVINNLLDQFVQNGKGEKEAIFRGVEEIDFSTWPELGAVEILKKDACVALMENNGVSFMVSGNYKKGRVLAVGHEQIFTTFLTKQKNWLIILRNMLHHLTHTKPTTAQNPLKILLTASTPTLNLSSLLARASIYVQMSYEQQLSSINLLDYDCILMTEASVKNYSEELCGKIVEFVGRGGALLVGFRGWVYKYYGEGKDLKNWESQCVYNRVLAPMGMKFTEGSTNFGKLKLKPTQPFHLIQTDKPYTKQLHPLFTQPPQTTSTPSLKLTLLQGVSQCTFSQAALSSFNFPQKSFTTIFKQNDSSYCIAGNYGKGNVVTFGHPLVFEKRFCQDSLHRRFLENVVGYLGKNKEKVSVGLLFQTGDWGNWGWERLGVNLSWKFVEKAEDFQNHDIICVSYYSHYPKALTPQVIDKLKQYVSNGGNLFFASHGWVWEIYGEYKENKSLKYEKDFASYVILKAFDIVLNKDSFSIDHPVIPLTLKDTKNKLLEGVGACNFEGTLSPFNFPEQSFISLLKEDDETFSAIGNYGKGKMLLFGHPGIFGNSYLQEASRKKFLSNALKWMTGARQKISVGLLYQSGDWSDFGWSNLGMGITSKFIQSPADFNGFDIICVSYYSHYPKTLTPQVIGKLKQYVSNGGNLFFASHGWVWQLYGEYKENNSLKYEKDFASYVILKAFDLTLSKDSWFEIANPYQISKNIVKKDEALENFLKNDLLTVLTNKDKNSFVSSDQIVNQMLSKINTVETGQFELICSIDHYHSIVDAFIKSRFNVEKNYDKIPFSDPFTCKVFSFMNALSYAVPPHICRALPPSLNKYPGYATHQLKEKTVEVYRNRNNRVFTGLYLNPGEVIRIRHKNSFQETMGVQLKVNLNSDLSNHDNGNLKRFTHISRTFKIKPEEFLIASPHGGIIYFEVDQDATQTKPLLFTFEGAYEGIYWNEKIHSYADFQKIKKVNAPIFIIETKRMNLIGPTQGLLSQVEIPIEKLCNFWNKVVGIYKDYCGIEQYPFQKQSYFNDVNIMLGYMHSGNPVMTHEDLTLEMIGVGQKLFKSATWGFYHELGHNHQDYKWTVDETVEVTCNIFSLLLINKMHGITIEENMWKERKLQPQVIKYFEKPVRTMKDYGKDPFLALVLYAVIMEQFGYEVFSQVHKAYHNIQLPNETYQTKFDTLVEQVSIATKHNMWQYFKNWGMPVTNSSLSKVKGFKKYSCKRFPFMTKQ